MAIHLIDDLLNYSIDCHIVALAVPLGCMMMAQQLRPLSFANELVVGVVFCCLHSMYLVYYIQRSMLHDRSVADAAIYFVWPLKTNWKDSLNYFCYFRIILLFRNKNTNESDYENDGSSINRIKKVLDLTKWDKEKSIEIADKNRKWPRKKAEIPRNRPIENILVKISSNKV